MKLPPRRGGTESLKAQVARIRSTGATSAQSSTSSASHRPRPSRTAHTPAVVPSYTESSSGRPPAPPRVATPGPPLGPGSNSSSQGWSALFDSPTCTASSLDGPPHSLSTGPRPCLPQYICTSTSGKQNWSNQLCSDRGSFCRQLTLGLNVSGKISPQALWPFWVFFDVSGCTSPILGPTRFEHCC